MSIRRKSKKIGQCIYCGQIGALTYDHIPPKNLFTKPRPSLIKVPSCKSCNENASKDDEYFRLMLTLKDEVYEHPDIKQILPTVYRSLSYPKGTGLKNSLLRNYGKVELRTPGGIYLGKRGAYNVDLVRLDKVAKRITTGLFYHETKSRLPDEYETIAYSEDGMRSLSTEFKTQIQKDI